MVNAADRGNVGRVLSVNGDTATVHFINRAEGTEARVDLPTSSLTVAQTSGSSVANLTGNEFVKALGQASTADEVADVFRLGERRSSELSICLNENCASYLVIGLLSFKNGAFENPVASGSKSLT